VLFGSDFENNNRYEIDECLACDASYTFTLTDSYGDGICCGYGTGDYEVEWIRGQGDILHKSGGEFGDAEIFSFSGCDVNSPTPTPICDGKLFKLDLRTDKYGSETTWEVKGSGGGVEAAGGPYENESDETFEQCIPNDACDFAIFDSYGDGICCNYGAGSFAVSIDGVQVEGGSGGAFGDGQSINLCNIFNN